jgi:hypothetical protein
MFSKRLMDLRQRIGAADDKSRAYLSIGVGSDLVAGHIQCSGSNAAAGNIVQA